MSDITHNFSAEGQPQYEVAIAGPNNSLDFSRIAGASVDDVAANNAIGGIEVVHRITVPDGSTGNVDTTLSHKERVIDVHLVKTVNAGGASDTITVLNATNAITNAMSINVADKTVVRAGTIDDAYWEIAAGGTLRVTRTKASAANVACEVFVHCLRVA